MVRLRYVYGEAKRDPPPPPPPLRNEARPLFLSRRPPTSTDSTSTTLRFTHPVYVIVDGSHAFTWLDIVPSLILEDRRVVTVVFSQQCFRSRVSYLKKDRWKESIFRRTRFCTRVDRVVRIAAPPLPHYFYNSKSWKNRLSFTTLLLRNH